MERKIGLLGPTRKPLFAHSALHFKDVNQPSHMGENTVVQGCLQFSTKKHTFKQIKATSLLVQSIIKSNILISYPSYYSFMFSITSKLLLKRWVLFIASHQILKLE